MGREAVPETSEKLHLLARLCAREDFIGFGKIPSQADQSVAWPLTYTGQYNPRQGRPEICRRPKQATLQKIFFKRFWPRTGWQNLLGTCSNCG